MTWSMPARFTIFLFLFTVAYMLPAPLWAAAIAPLTESRDLMRSVEISTFKTSNISSLWQGDDATATFTEGNYSQWLTDYGLFSFDIGLMKENLRESASGASTVLNGTNIHAKLDKTNFNYIGRSYGAGGDAGITYIPDTMDPLSYQYTNHGFNSTVSCFYNDSMSWDIVHLGANDNLPISMWQFQGGDATGESDAYWTYVAWLKEDLLAYQSVYDPAAQKIKVQINSGASGSAHDVHFFGQLSLMQCDISINEQDVDVKVHNEKQTIEAQLTGKPTPTLSPVATAVVEEVSNVLSTISWNDGCIGGCEMGKALVINANQLKYQANSNSNETVFRATEDFFASLVDNALVKLRQTRLASNAQDSTQNMTATVEVSALVFGNVYFIYMLCIFNLSIVFAYVVEFIRTHGWKGTPSLDIMNDSLVIIAGFEGGQRFERDFLEGGKYEMRQERMTEDSLLMLHYQGLASDRPVFMSYHLADGHASDSGEEGLLEGRRSMS